MPFGRVLTNGVGSDSGCCFFLKFRLSLNLICGSLNALLVGCCLAVVFGFSSFFVFLKLSFGIDKFSSQFTFWASDHY